MSDLQRITGRAPRESAAIADAVSRFSQGGAVDLKKLQSKQGAWRIRHGDWRILLDRQPDGSFEVTRVQNRRDAYLD